MRNVLVASAISLFILCLWSCANQTTPTGGPKDTIPPNLIKSKPAHRQRNFTDKTIELTFDEYVNINNPKDEILISPAITEDLEFKARKNTVIIRSPAAWEKSTTYSITFREGIRDLTESNAPENLRLAFSTGNLIDSMIVKGRIKHATKESIPEKITVALYRSDTFNIFEHKPNYITVNNKRGVFSLENIKSGTYYVYAFEDKNKNLKVESRTEKFGFLKDSILLTGPLDSLYIPLVNLDMRKPVITNYRNNGISTTIKLNKYIKTYSLAFASKENIIHSYGDDQTEVVFYNPKELKDSLMVSFSGRDSVDFKVDSVFYIRAVEPNSIRSNFAVRPTSPKYNLNNGEVTTNFKLSKPLSSINYDSIFIQTDSAKYIYFTHEDFSYDSIQKNLFLKKKIERDSLFVSKKTKTELILGKGTFISIESDSSKGLLQTIPTASKAETGTLLIEVQTKEPNYIVILTNAAGEILQELKNVKKHTFTFLPAQNYKLKVIIDRNNNGKWDPGNFFKRQEPEPIYFYQTADKKYDFPIRANWELGPIMLIF